MNGLLRYTATDWLRSQRWGSPTLIMVVTVVVLYAGMAQSSASSYAVTASLLFPLTAWLVVTSLNCEGSEQRSIISVAAGGVGKVLLARMLVACAWAAGLALFSLAWSLLLTDPTRQGWDVLAGAVAHLVSIVGGAGLGIMLSRPMVKKPGYVALWVVGIFVLEFGVRALPPVGPMVVLLTAPASATVGGLIFVTVETFLFSGLLTFLAVRMIRRHG